MNRLNDRQETASERIERHYHEKMKEIDDSYAAQKAQNNRTFKRQMWLILGFFVIYLAATLVIQVAK